MQITIVCTLCKCYEIAFSVCAAFSKPRLNIWKFTVHILLKPGLENWGLYFVSV